MTRNAAVAGQFYEEDFKKLELQIKECFHHKLGPGALPVKKRSGFIKAIISPHAGYMFSGACAAWGFKEIAESEMADTYILIGPNHYGLGSALSIEDWKTPFGFLKSDKDLVRDIELNTDLKINDSFHANEHSIEVQLPFLQFANKAHLNEFKIVCITLSNDIDIVKLAADLKSILSKQNKKITFIISSDFTHYGSHYKYLPFTLEIDKRLKELDEGAIKLILEKSPEKFISYIKQTGATICGTFPIYLLLNLLDDEVKPELLMYYKSSDIVGDNRNSVSYVSITFK